jgi:predicted RNase H-like HicB family nuclease
MLVPDDLRGGDIMREFDSASPEVEPVQLKAIVHVADEGGYWGEVPSIPGCASQGETMEELVDNLREAIAGCLSVDVESLSVGEHDRVVDVAI